MSTLPRWPWGQVIRRVLIGFLGALCAVYPLWHMGYLLLHHDDHSRDLVAHWLIGLIFGTGVVTVWLACDVENRVLTFLAGLSKFVPFLRGKNGGDA